MSISLFLASLIYSGFFKPNPEITAIFLIILFSSGLFTVLNELKLVNICSFNSLYVKSVSHILPIFVFLSKSLGYLNLNYLQVLH